MTFEKPAGLKQEIETWATYILEWRDETLKIAFQIDHQDLSARARELGLAWGNGFEREDAHHADQ